MPCARNDSAPDVVTDGRMQRLPAELRPDQPVPNLLDYESAARDFSWARARRDELDGLPDGAGLNIAYEAVDRHVRHGRGSHLAIRWLGRKGESRDYSYAELQDVTNRVANGLTSLGLEPGDRLFLLAGRVPELYATVLGALKARLVVSPLFAAFGPEPVRTRMSLGKAKALVTTPQLYERKVRAIRPSLRDLEHVLLIGAERSELPTGTTSLAELAREVSADFTIAATDPEDPALLHFTSGTTGAPKGALHVHEAVVAHHVTGKLALDLHAGDRFWCTADPGWVTGTSYGIICPLTNGATNVVDEADFDVERWYRILQDERITVWYTAPTAIRMLMRAGADVARGFDLSALRLVASVGEALNPEAVVWGREALGLPIHDTWWQTETGAIMVANYRSMEIRPGSMGLPVPGVEAKIVRRLAPRAGEQAEDEASPQVQDVDEPGADGELALRRGWPSMFRAYVGQEALYRRSFAGDWYLTGDLCHRDEDGFLWFVGRADDLIKSAGHLIGPFEVESALLEHPAVAEAAVIGVPDPTVGHIVKAFVSLEPGRAPSEELRLELLGHARSRLGPAVAPRAVEFRDDLPRTRSGKIMRRLLQARELGLPEGDISTLESSDDDAEAQDGERP